MNDYIMKYYKKLLNWIKNFYKLKEKIIYVYEVLMYYYGVIYILFLSSFLEEN